jgi:hypothetical protein
MRPLGSTGRAPGRWAAALFSLLALVAVAVRAAESPIPADLQVQLLLRIFSFDRALTADAADELVVGVLVQKRYRASFDAAEEMLAALDAASREAPRGQRIRGVAVPCETPDSLATELDLAPIDILYVTPLRAFGVDRIAAAVRPRHIRTLTAVPDLVERGLGVGLNLRDERPEIVVNLPAAQAEGADFSSQLLGHARVLR